MAAVHMASMTFAQRLAHVDNIQQQDSAERAFNKLTPTFATQLEALKRYRSTGEQRTTVEHQHVTVDEGGQGIMGNVTAPVGEMRRKKGAEQPHAKQLTHAPGGTLLGNVETLRPFCAARPRLGDSRSAGCTALVAARRKIIEMPESMGSIVRLRWRNECLPGANSGTSPLRTFNRRRSDGRTNPDGRAK
jgi:hypothetical protein